MSSGRIPKRKRPKGPKMTQRETVAKPSPVVTRFDPSIISDTPRRSNHGRTMGATSNGWATYPASRTTVCEVCSDAVVPGEQIVDFPSPQNGEAVRHFRCTPTIGAKPV